jgi:hypothetical protein
MRAKTNATVTLVSAAVAFSPLLLLVLVWLIQSAAQCQVSEVGPTPCVVAGLDIGSSLHTLGMAAMWGFLVTMPLGLIVDFVLRRRRESAI